MSYIGNNEYCTLIDLEDDSKWYPIGKHNRLAGFRPTQATVNWTRFVEKTKTFMKRGGSDVN